MVEQIPRPDAGSFPIRSAVIGLFSVQSAIGLASDRELGGLVSQLSGQAALADNIDYFGTIFDTGFLAFGVSTVLNQAGLTSEEPNLISKASLNDMACKVTLSIGREKGTWMPTAWAASGARLSLPMDIRFSEDVVDLGYPGEDALSPTGSRFARKLICDGGSFVGAQGEVVVRANGGAWSTEPSGVPGASTLNFFVDFPAAATRNDVTLPEGRVFFSCACWDSKEALPPGIIDGASLDMPNGETAGVVEGPGGVYVLDKGGLSIKRNDFRNGWGALGDVMLILGRFSVAAAS